MALFADFSDEFAYNTSALFILPTTDVRCLMPLRRCEVPNSCPLIHYLLFFCHRWRVEPKTAQCWIPEGQLEITDP